MQEWVGGGGGGKERRELLFLKRILDTKVCVKDVGCCCLRRQLVPFHEGSVEE